MSKTISYKVGLSQPMLFDSISSEIIVYLCLISIMP